MNKTINVNIGGRVFNIEEAAFEKLNQYINSIRSYFGSEESAAEIIADIELRIAELFMERTNEQKQVVVMKDVEEVITIMGRPEEFAEGTDADSSERTGSTRSDASKRVFRDPDDKVIFGVCSGISAYFGWDPLILRVLFAAAFLLFGSGLLLYILLALIIPSAKTTAQKLQMRGEPVTVENISRKVGESFGEIKEDLKDFGKKNDLNEERLKREGARVSSFLTQVGHFIMNILQLIGKLLARFIGAVLFIAAVFGILVLVSALLGWDFAFKISDGNVFMEDHLDQFANAVFADYTQRTLFIWGAGGLTVIPLILLLLLSIRLLFDYRKIPAYTSVALIALWVVSLAATAIAGINLYQEFHFETGYSENISLPPSEHDLMVIDIVETGEPEYSFSTGFGDGRAFFHGSVTFPGLDSTDILYTGQNKLTVEMADKNSTYELEVERKARGADRKDAINNARDIRMLHQVTSDSLRIYPRFALQQGQKIRAQEVLYTLYVPVGKRVHFTGDAATVIYDVPNISNTYDEDMAGKTWIMTRNGLACESCLSGKNSSLNDTVPANSSY